MGNWYKQLVANLTLADVMPELARDTEVCRLDAERERLAREYLAADGMLLRRIAAHLRNDGSGRWSDYIKKRVFPGGATPNERMHLSMGRQVDVVRFDRAAVTKFTRCPACDELLPKCSCAAYEEWAQQDREAQDGVTLDELQRPEGDA